MLAIYDNNGEYSDWCVYFVRVKSEEQAEQILEFVNKAQAYNNFELVSVCEKISWRSEKSKIMSPGYFLWAGSCFHQRQEPDDIESVKFTKKMLKLVSQDDFNKALAEEIFPIEDRIEASHWQDRFTRWQKQVRNIAVLNIFEEKDKAP